MGRREAIISIQRDAEGEDDHRSKKFYAVIQSLIFDKNQEAKNALERTMIKGTRRTPNPKCRLYWCLIEFIDWRYNQSSWYFRSFL